MGCIGQGLFPQLQFVRQAVNGWLYRAATENKSAVGDGCKAQNNQVLQLQRQPHRVWQVNPAPQLRHRHGTAPVTRMALRKARAPVVFHQQMGFAHLPQLAGVHDGSHQSTSG